MNPYDVLEVTPDAEQGTLREAYRRLVRLHHPDLAPNQERREQSHAHMQRINQAWQLVGEPAKRADFDAKRAEVRQAEMRSEEARRNQEISREQEKKKRATATKSHRAKLKSSSSRSKSVNEKAESSKPVKSSSRASPSKAPTASASSTRHKLKRLKKTRSPEEIRVRNRQKVIEASQFWKEGRSADAIASCQSVLRNDFRNVAAREVLGDIYLGLGETTKALVLFEQALALQSGSVNLRRKIATIRARVGTDGVLREELGNRQKFEANLKFQNETIPVSPVIRPKSGEPVQETGFWRRLCGKLSSRR